MSAATCRYCGATIFWAKHKRTEKPAPIDDEASSDGNIALDLEEETYTVLTGTPLEEARARGQHLHTNHFMTCPSPPPRRRT
jgi:hypothetical protein